MSEAFIRTAGPDDAETLAALGAATFSESFAHLYPAEDLAAFLADAHGVDRWRSSLADPAKATWLMEVDGEAVGYAMVGDCALPHPEVTPGCGELKRIYLLKAWQGGGRGSRLMETALAWLEANRTGSLWIGVWSRNHGAQRLYGRMGFERAGEYGFRVGQMVDDEFILRRG